MAKVFTVADLRKKSYEMYCLFWMLSHDYGLPNLLNALDEQVNEAEDANINPSIAFLGFEDVGFHGELWACFDEFMEYEYQDTEYMEMLLGLSPIKEIWLKLYHEDILAGRETKSNQIS